MPKIAKDILNIDLVLDAPDSIISMYTAMQMMLRNVYISCMWRKLNHIRWHGIEDYPEPTKLPYHEKYCLSVDATKFTCKYGYVDYKCVPIKSLERVLWYAEHDAYRVLQYLNKHSLTQSTNFTKDSLYKLLSDPTSKINGRLLYDIRRPVITAQAGTTIIQQALYGKGIHKLGTFMLPVTKWDIPIQNDSLQYLRDHFPAITCKIETVFIYTGLANGNKKVLCVRLRCVNKFDPSDINTIGELIYHDPYVITYPNKRMLESRYPMLVQENGYKFKKSYDYYFNEVYKEAIKLMPDNSYDHTVAMPERSKIPDNIWLDAADVCAKRYRTERMNKDRVMCSYGNQDDRVANGRSDIKFFEF